MPSGGGSPTQQHSPSSSSGSGRSGSGGSPGFITTTQEPMLPGLQADASPPPAALQPRSLLKDYLPLSPQTHVSQSPTAAGATFAAGCIDGPPGSGIGGARWGPIGGEMRGRHDSGVYVPNDFVGDQQQPAQTLDSLGIGSLGATALLHCFGTQPALPWSAK